MSAYRGAPNRRVCHLLLADACLVLLIIVCSGVAATAAPAIDLKPIATGLPMPTTITHAGDGSGRLFITLQGGQIVIHDGTQLLPTPFLDIATIISCCGERGLLGLTFHRHYATNGLFYVDYTNTNGDVVVARYAVSSDPNRAQTSGSVLLTIPHETFGNHNGGQLAFGPDGYLYIGVGDGGGAGDTANNAQNLGILLGKLLRIDIDGAAPYAIPATNPFVGTPGARGEIWAYGLRNPWRFSFDRLTGDLFIGDVGQNAWEEVDFQPASSAGGQNYGWRRMEGTHCFNPSTGCNDGTLTLPIIEYPHAVVGANPADCSITGGYRYRGTGLPALTGYYVFGDFCSGRIMGATLSGATWSVSQIFDTPFQISTFGEDQMGELYVAQYDGANGVVYRIVNHSFRDFNGDGKADILWRHTSGLVYEWLLDGTSVTSTGSPGTASTDWTVVGVGDFNGDGKADILWRHTSGLLSLWLLDGTSVTSTGSPGTADTEWTVVGVGDFNGDGKADILWRHTSGLLSLWLLDGTSVTSTGSPGTAGTDWTVVGVGDFNGDGKADILWHHTSGLVYEWLLDGTNVIGTGSPGGAATDWSIVGVGDFNGDGKADILWRHSSGLVYEWLLNGTSVIGQGAPGAAGTDWTVVGVGDFNGDGKADILWRHTSGLVYEWLLDGTSVTGTGSPGGAPTDWVIR